MDGDDGVGGVDDDDVTHPHHHHQSPHLASC